jgi:hypothetical protein
MKRFLLLFVLLLTAGSVARANTLVFTLSGVETGYFQLDSNPTPVDHVDGQYTKFMNLTFTDGQGTTVNNYQILFFSTADLGSFADIYQPGFYGLQVYSGTEANPVFAPGTFYASQVQFGPLDETLTISVAPEPSSLIFTLTGLASTAFVGARRKWTLRA